MWVVTKYYFSKIDHGTSACRSTVGFSVIDPVHNAKIHVVDNSFLESLYTEFREAPLCSEIGTSAQSPIK